MVATETHPLFAVAYLRPMFVAAPTLPVDPEDKRL